MRHDNCSTNLFSINKWWILYFWLSKIDGGNEGYGRRYTAQSLAGK